MDLVPKNAYKNAAPLGDRLIEKNSVKTHPRPLERADIGNLF
jgi:hypothetical protein